MHDYAKYMQIRPPIGLICIYFDTAIYPVIIRYCF